MAKFINVAMVFLFGTLILMASGSLKHEVNSYDGFSVHHIMIKDVSLHTWIE